MKIAQIMNKLKSLFFLTLFLMANTSFSLQDSVVAIVNDKVILQSDLDERMREVNLQKLSRIEFAKIKNNILDQLIEDCDGVGGRILLTLGNRIKDGIVPNIEFSVEHCCDQKDWDDGFHI